MTPDEMKRRTRAFALRVIRLYESLPKTKVAQHIGYQLVRAATSVAANYRASCRAKSKADFIAKMGIVEEEADECVFWLEMLVDAKIVAEKLLAPLKKEAEEITAIVVSSITTARGQKRPRTRFRNPQSTTGYHIDTKGDSGCDSVA
ncbi:MAG: four helix bundle protein [Phycisphaerae bacterium]|nr:four helix bundle protein [Phycisphaerae bacterium]